MISLPQSQSAGITGVHHHYWVKYNFYMHWEATKKHDLLYCSICFIGWTVTEPMISLSYDCTPKHTWHFGPKSDIKDVEGTDF
jgi:hypothetical protein